MTKLRQAGSPIPLLQSLQRLPASAASTRAASGRRPSIHTSIAPNTAAAMHRAVTVMRIRSSVPGFGGSSPAEVLLDGLGEVRLDLADVSHDPAGVEFLGPQRRRSWRRPSRRTVGPGSPTAPTR